MIRKLIAISVLIVLGNHVFPQSLNSDIQVITEQTLPSEFRNRNGSVFTLKQKGSLEEDVSGFLSKLYDYGYLECSVDSIVKTEQTTNLFLNLGRRFIWAGLGIQLSESKLDIEIPRRLIPDNNSVLSLRQFNQLREYIVGEYENNGYPFVSVGLDSVKILDSLLYASLRIEQGKRFYIDSIIVRAEIPLSAKILQRVSGLKMGDWYSEEDLISAQKRLQKGGFISNQESLEVGFFDDKAWIYVNPEIQKKNRIDGLIGILPSQGSGVPAIAGEFNLLLKNLLKQTESLSIRWKAPGGSTQKLNSQFAIPYFLGLPIGLSGQLDLYKKDTSYLNLGISGGIRISFQPEFWLDVLFENRSSSTLASDLYNSYPEFEINLSKLILGLDNRDNPYNPRTGWLLKNEVAYGRKQKQEAGTNSIEQNYWEIETQTSKFFPVKQNWTLLFSINAGYRYGQLSTNEKYRIGGFELMRGFQEESLLVSKYAVATSEIRLLFSGLSNIHLFFDYGLLDTNFAFSPGMGMSIQTRAGILRLDYAIGQLSGQKFELQNGLIHLGIQSIF